MTRLGFLAGLFGAEHMQVGRWYEGTTKVEMSIPTGCGSSNGRGCVPYIPKPANGECPVCGTVAEPWTEPLACKETEYRAGPGNTAEVRCTEYHPPRQRFIACAHCNNVFRQFAEAVPR